ARITWIPRTKPSQEEKEAKKANAYQDPLELEIALGLEGAGHNCPIDPLKFELVLATGKIVGQRNRQFGAVSRDKLVFRDHLTVDADVNGLARNELPGGNNEHTASFNVGLVVAIVAARLVVSVLLNRVIAVVIKVIF